MIEQNFTYLTLLQGVPDPGGVAEKVKEFWRKLGGSDCGPTETFIGDYVEKGQTAPDRRSDFTGQPIFLVVTPLLQPEQPFELPRSLAAAGSELVPFANCVNSWLLKKSFQRLSDRTVPRSEDWLQIVMMNVEPGFEGEFDEWYESEHVARIATIADEFVSVQRFVAELGSPRYFALWRMRDRKSPEREPWLSASETPWTLRIRRYMRERRRLVLTPFDTSICLPAPRN